jgi:hypothetical protein
MDGTERFDISRQTREICVALGLEPSHVGELTITPFSAVATVYKVDEQGSKYIVEDGEAQTEQRTFRVRA